jgi:hypothetical protein
MNRRLLLLISALCITLSISALKPDEAADILSKAGKNRAELEKAISFYKKKGDSQRLNALYFLLKNMDIHYSANYYWANEANQRVYYNELDYPDYNTSLKKFNELKTQTKVHPVVVRYTDTDSIKSSLLINNIEKAFEAWKQPYAKHLSFADFCEYILPYRFLYEPLTDWRTKYQQRFGKLAKDAPDKSVTGVTNLLFYDVNSWFVNTYNIEERKEPLPLLSAPQLLFRKQGPCDDIASLYLHALRTLGIPSCIDMAPLWAASSGRHLWNVVFDDKMQPHPFDTDHKPAEFKMLHEPAKIIRFTYAKQADCLGALLPADQIPDGFMRLKSYKDVTKTYWPVKDVVCRLSNASSQKVAYACVINYSMWQPAWWGWVAGNSTQFTQMGCGAVYLPMYYQNGKLVPAGYPVAVKSANEQFELVPGTGNTRTITIREQESYLIFRPGKQYTLQYWDNEWKVLGRQTAATGARTLVFTNVPRNALLRLIPEYSQGKERPFTMDDKGERNWW